MSQWGAWGQSQELVHDYCPQILQQPFLISSTQPWHSKKLNQYSPRQPVSASKLLISPSSSQHCPPAAPPLTEYLLTHTTWECYIIHWKSGKDEIISREEKRKAQVTSTSAISSLFYSPVTFSNLKSNWPQLNCCSTGEPLWSMRSTLTHTFSGWYNLGVLENIFFLSVNICLDASASRLYGGSIDLACRATFPIQPKPATSSEMVTNQKVLLLAQSWTFSVPLLFTPTQPKAWPDNSHNFW